MKTNIFVKRNKFKTSIKVFYLKWTSKTAIINGHLQERNFSLLFCTSSEFSSMNLFCFQRFLLLQLSEETISVERSVAIQREEKTRWMTVSSFTKKTFIFPSNDKNWRRTFPFNIFSIREKDLERKESFTVWVWQQNSTKNIEKEKKKIKKSIF